VFAHTLFSLDNNDDDDDDDDANDRKVARRANAESEHLATIDQLQKQVHDVH
jgi:hypothetical protein